jgi:carboxypeptidase family protein
MGVAARSRTTVMAALVMAVGLGAAQEQVKPQPVPSRVRDTAPPPEQTGTSVIAGTIVGADTGRAVRRATVSITGPEGRRRTASTGESGEFSFTNLPPGPYTLTATRQGYLEVNFGQRQPGSGRPGTPIQLAAGQKLENISLQMPRAGVLTGLVTDEYGDPMMGVQVRAWRFVMRSGERTLQPAGSGTTDDRGIYRIPSLLPGEYLVNTMSRDGAFDLLNMQLEEIKMRSADFNREATAVQQVIIDAGKPPEPYTVAAMRGANSGNGAKTSYGTVYYPGTLLATSATPVTLGISEERAGVDMQLQVVPLAEVSGSVIGPDGTVPTGVEVRLVENGVPAALAKTQSARVRPDGTFTMSGVAPGQYTLIARVSSRMVIRTANWTTSGDAVLAEMKVDSKVYMAEKEALDAQGQAQNPLWAQADLNVDGRPLTNLVLPLRSGLEVSGTFAFDGTPPEPPDLGRIRIQLMPAGTSAIESNMAPPAATYNAGRFTLRGVMPGRYRLMATSVPAGWNLKSAVFGDSDVLDTMLEVKPGDDLSGGVLSFTRRTTELSGALQDQSGKPISDYTIVVFPPDRRYWTPLSRRIQAARPATDGRFAFRNLPAGPYRLIAVVDPEPGQWFDPAFLDQLLGAAMSVDIDEGERKVQDVRIVK